MNERAEIEAAMGRLLDGIPLRSDGKLTNVLTSENDTLRSQLSRPASRPGRPGQHASPSERARPG